MLLEEEVFELFQERIFNTKTNHYIFTGLTDFTILEKIPEKTNIRILEEDFQDIREAQNVKIDLCQVQLSDILSYVVEELKRKGLLDSSVSSSIPFDRRWLFRFSYLLQNSRVALQMIFFHLEQLKKEEQMALNEIYYFNSIFFNANSFLLEDHFQTYFLTGNRALDNRENYQEIKVLKQIWRP